MITSYSIIFLLATLSFIPNGNTMAQNFSNNSRIIGSYQNQQQQRNSIINEFCANRCANFQNQDSRCSVCPSQNQSNASARFPHRRQS
ncbi:unnamed protein product [Gordionus sp. m RMFG-2023]